MAKKIELKIVEVDKSKKYAKYYAKEQTYLEVCAGVPLLRFRIMDSFSWLDLAFSTRLGGISEGYLSSMNLGWDRGDKRETVQENYKILCSALGGDYRKLVLSDQVHDTKVCYVDETQMAGETIEKKVQGIDGLLTDQVELMLATSYADCVPLLFADPTHQAIACSHSGWRGTVGKIGKKTVQAMQDRFSTIPEDVVVVIGPSICQDCYQVSEEVAADFLKAFGQENAKEICKKEEDNPSKYRLDLWAANWHVLREAGIKEENICISGVCTCCNAELLFSHRATQGQRGNLNAIMRIRGSKSV